MSMKQILQEALRLQVNHRAFFPSKNMQARAVQQAKAEHERQKVLLEEERWQWYNGTDTICIDKKTGLGQNHNEED